MSIWTAIVLGLIQGATEFLPVSSSGHLVLYRLVTGAEMADHVLFDVMLHVGTLVALLAVYWPDAVVTLVGLLRGLAALPNRRRRQAWQGDADFRTAVWLILASVPAALAGFFLGEWVEQVGQSASAVGVLLLLNGWVLFFSSRRRVRTRPMTADRAAVIGLAQAAAILPGLSRSGMTISAGLAADQDRPSAARFSFLLAIPVIAGAAAFKLAKGGGAAGVPWPAILVGMAVSAGVGYAALRLLLKVLARGRFSVFAYYCWAVALAIIIWDRLA